MTKKNILITGASRGIGYSLAEKFLAEGHNVFVISRNKEKLEKLADKALSFGNKLKFAAIDLSDLTEIQKINSYIEDWTHIDVIYNNAGLLIKKPFTELTAEDFTESWKVNFLAPCMLIKNLFSKLSHQSHIVNISTMGAVQGSVKFPELSAYGSSKGALISLTEILAQEFDGAGPRLNCVALGAVQTEMLEKAFPGYEAPITPNGMAEYLYDFGLNGHRFMNGKIVQCSVSTP